MKRSYQAVSIAAAMVMMQGCYHFRVDTTAPQGTEIHKKTMHAFLWGLVQPSPIDDCDDKGVTDVRASTNLGYQVISVATLGIWVPMDVEWRCTKRPPPTPGDQ